MYRIDGFRDGGNYCLEITTPFEKRYKVFPTFAGRQEYLDGFIWHLQMRGQHYELEVDRIG